MDKLFVVFVENAPFIEDENALLGTELNKFSDKVFNPIFRVFSNKKEANMYLDIVRSFDGTDTAKTFEVVETDLEELKEMKQVLEVICSEEFEKSLRIVMSYWGEFWPVNVDLDLNVIN